MSNDDQSIRGMVIIPLLRAIVTGLLVGLALFTLYVLSDQVTGWRLFWAVLAGVSLLAWLVAHRLPTLSPGGSKPPHTVTLAQSRIYSETTRVELVANDPSGQFSAGRWADLPVDLPTLITVARHLDAGASFSHGSMSGPHRPLSRSQYESLRDLMVLRSLAYWINPASHSQGVELTRAGRAVMEHFAGLNPLESHPPQLPEVLPIGNRLPKPTHAHRRTRGGSEVLLRD